MCLAGRVRALGRGLGDGPALDPARVVMTGVRDLDGGERVELERAGVGTAPPDKLAGALEGDEVFVHLDLDVLDPSVLPGAVPGARRALERGPARPARRARRVGAA